MSKYSAKTYCESQATQRCELALSLCKAELKQRLQLQSQ